MQRSPEMEAIEPMSPHELPSRRDIRAIPSAPSLLATADQETTDIPPQPPDRGRSSTRPWLAGIYLLVFGAVGTYVMAVLPISNAVEGRSWVRSPCRVVDSGVRRHGGKFGPTYSVDIVYEYDVAGRSYRSDRWDFFPSLPGIGYDSMASVARLYPAGRMLECYVNPLDPCQAVLDRRIQSGFPRILLPLGLLALGSAMVYPFACNRRTDSATPAVPHDAIAEGKASSPRWHDVPTALGVAVFLNAGAYVMGRILLDGWREGQLKVGLAVLVVFIGVMGVVMIGVLLRVLLGCLSSRHQA
jgi:hypothetical protein